MDVVAIIAIVKAVWEADIIPKVRKVLGRLFRKNKNETDNHKKGG